MPEPTDYIDQVLHDIAHGIAPRADIVTAALDQRRREKACAVTEQPYIPYWRRFLSKERNKKCR